jgi:hypothetical protein
MIIKHAQRTINVLWGFIAITTNVRLGSLVEQTTIARMGRSATPRLIIVETLLDATMTPNALQYKLANYVISENVLRDNNVPLMRNVHRVKSVKRLQPIWEETQQPQAQSISVDVMFASKTVHVLHLQNATEIRVYFNLMAFFALWIATA